MGSRWGRRRRGCLHGGLEEKKVVIQSLNISQKGEGPVGDLDRSVVSPASAVTDQPRLPGPGACWKCSGPSPDPLGPRGHLSRCSRVSFAHSSLRILVCHSFALSMQTLANHFHIVILMIPMKRLVSQGPFCSTVFVRLLRVLLSHLLMRL